MANSSKSCPPSSSLCGKHPGNTGIRIAEYGTPNTWNTCQIRAKYVPYSPPVRAATPARVLGTYSHVFACWARIRTYFDTFSSYILPVKQFCYSLQRTYSMYKWPRLVLWATTAHAVTIIVLGSTMKVHAYLLAHVGF